MKIMRVFLVFLSFLLSSYSSWVLADEHDLKNVLIIHSYHADYEWTSSLNKGFTAALSPYQNIHLFREYMDAKRNPKGEYQKHFYDYLVQKYTPYHLDAIIISDDPAMQFIKKYRSDIFISTPIIYVGINRVTPELLKTKGMSGVFEYKNLRQIISDIKAFTGESEIVVVSDPSASGNENKLEILSIKASLQLPDSIHLIGALRDRDISQEFRIFPPTIPVLLLGQILDTSADNRLMSWSDGSALLTGSLKNPIFSIGNFNLDYGCVGIHVISGEDHAKMAVGLLLRVLNGESVDDIQPITKPAGKWLFNWQNVKKHHLTGHAFPAHSEVLYRDKSFYEENKTLVHVISVFFVGAILVILLLIEVIRRGYRNQKILLENESRYRDLAHAGASVFWETNPLHQFSYLSGDAQSLFGYFLEEHILGRTFSDICKNNPNVIWSWKEYQEKITKHLPLDNLICKINFPDEKQKIILVNGKAIFDKKGEFLGYRGITREITQEYLLSEKMAYQASHDSLTGLINRNSFNQELKKLVEEIPQTREAFVCFLDLDNFKIVNDTVGYLVGDIMLGEISTILAACIGKRDVLGRLGGDEFGLILYDRDQSQAQQICEKIIDEIQKYRFNWRNKFFSVGVSIGVVPHTQNLNQVELMSKADLACYQAKELGKGRIYITGEKDEQLYSEELQLGYISSVAQAIEEERFFLAKQMIAPVSDVSNSSRHYEILIRYQDEDGKLISPELFIPAAEKHGLIILIDKWVIKTVLERYQEFFPEMDTMVSINLSGISFSSKDFVEQLTRDAQLSTIKPQNICFEITETAVMSQISQAQDFIRKMKKFGYKFALDDFGSGASSFGYLKQLPVDYLKIDGSLVRNIVTEPTDKAIVESINSIAHMMGMKTIAEFVENQDIRNILQDIGVDYVQGYGVHKPETCEGQNR